MNHSSVITRPVGNIPDGLSTTTIPNAHLTAPTGVPGMPTFERYQILGELGRGGMGVVFKAFDLDLKRTVAIKMILHGSMAAHDAIARFRAETEAVGRLNHPNLVRIYETGHVDGRPFAVMEYIEGGTLADHIACRTFSPEEAARIIADLAEGIESAHQRGVLHRDLKPANILLNGQQPKVVDFGLAKLEGTNNFTHTGDVIGTPNYMAPERVTGPKSEIGVGVDVYALGAILFEMLTRHMPFEGVNAVEILRFVVDLPAPSVRAFRKDVSRDLDTICQKCLHKNPAKRYGTAGELAADLKRYLRGDPIQARPIKTWERSWRWAKRNPTIAVSLASLTVVMVTALFVFAMAAQRFRGLAAERQEALKKEEQAADEGRFRLYQSNMAGVSSNLQLNNRDTARRALDTAPKVHRGWEWNYFNAQMDLSEFVVRDATSQTHAAVFHPDGRRAILMRDHEIVLYDVHTYELLATIPTGKPNRNIVFRLHPNGQELLVAKEHGPVLRYNLDRQELTPFPLPEMLDLPGAELTWWPEYAPDGQHLMLSTNYKGRNHVLLLTVEGQLRRLFVGDSNAVVHRFLPDRQRILVGDRAFIRVWSLDGKLLQEIRTHPYDLSATALSFDGKRLATSGMYPQHAVQLWDLDTGRHLASMRTHTNSVHTMAFSRDGKYLVTGSLDETACIWNGETGQLLKELLGHTQQLRSVVVTPDNRSAITTSDDSTIRMWDLATGHVQAVLRGHETQVFHGSINANGTKYISMSPDGSIRFWNIHAIQRRSILGTHDKFVYGLAVHPTKPIAASSAWDGTVREWDVRTGQMRNCFDQPNRVVADLSYSPSGERLAVVMRQERIHEGFLAEWNPAERRIEYNQLLRGGFWSLETCPAYSSDGQWLALGGEKELVHVWNTTGKRTVTYYYTNLPPERNADTGPVAWHPTKPILASVLANGAIALWELHHPKEAKIIPAHERTPTHISYSKDGRWLVTAGEDRKVIVWDGNTHEKLATLAHGCTVYDVAFHPTEKRLVTACADNSIRVWDLDRFEEVAELRGHSKYVHAVAFTPDGVQLLSGSGDGTVRIWDSRPIAKFADP